MAAPYEDSVQDRSIEGTRHDGIVWGYETPIDAASAIAGLVSFYPDRARITVDGVPA
jgi:uncharacterized protein (DUF427 family)